MSEWIAGVQRHDDPVTACKIFADWLEERGQWRATVVRENCVTWTEPFPGWGESVAQWLRLLFFDDCACGRGCDVCGGTGLKLATDDVEVNVKRLRIERRPVTMGPPTEQEIPAGSEIPSQRRSDVAEFAPIVLNMGGEKTCEFCGKVIKPPPKTPNANAAMEADGLVLTSHPPLAMHSNCLRQGLIFLAAQYRLALRCGTIKDGSGQAAVEISPTAQARPAIPGPYPPPEPIPAPPPAMNNPTAQAVKNQEAAKKS